MWQLGHIIKYCEKARSISEKSRTFAADFI